MEEAATVEEVCEPFLVRAGMIARTPRGRVATAPAWTHLGLVPPVGVAGLTQPGLFFWWNPMIIAALIFAGLAALLHVYIFTMESLTWTSPRTRATFGTTPDEAETTKLLAFNQGFYNLFLGIVTGIGIAAIAMGHNAVGAALIFAGVGSMAAAAVVLLMSAPDKVRAALTQGTFPVIAIVLLVVGLMA